MCYIVYVNKCSYYSIANLKKEDVMEDLILVVKTLLKCYPHLDDLYDAITRSVEECVESGFYAIFPNEQMRLYERIYAYERRKVGIYNMKYLIEEAFRRGKGNTLSILRERYLNKKEMGELTHLYGVSLRTCYRHVKRGLTILAETLLEMGFDKRRILTEYGDEPLFLTMLNRVIKEDDAERAAESERQEREEKDRGISRPLPPLCHLYSERAFCEDGRAR